MSCMLCLENQGLGDDYILMDSTESQVLEVRQIVEMHLWIEVEKVDSAIRLICQQCWEFLFTFHQFYVRIQRAHNVLENILNSTLEIKRDIEYIKVEPDLIEEPSKPKRGRGRPRRQQPTEEEKLVSEAFYEKETVDELPEIDCLTAEVVEDKEQKVDPFQKENNDCESNQLLSELLIPIKRAPIPVTSLKRGRRRSQRKTDASKKSSSKLKARKYVSGRKKHVDGGNVRKSNRTIKEGNLDDENDVLGDELHSDDEKVEIERRLSNLHKTSVSQKNDEFIAQNLKLNCCLCQSPFKNFSELKSHFRTKHNTRGYVLCCGKKLMKRGVLVDHIHVHLDPYYFKCPQCEKVLADRRCLELHNKCHQDKRERIYRCEICSKTFFKHSILTRHLLLHAPEEDKKFLCPQCNKPFVTKYNMEQHLKLVHLNMYAKICDICGKSIRGREALRRHQEMHAGVPQAPIQCDQCGVTLTTKYGLARHIKVMHTEENLKPRICTLCSKVSHTIGAHKNHMKFMHGMERKHACPMCDKAFKRAKDLKEHMTTHTGEVLYTCTYCPKTFNSNANMYAHRKKMHPVEWEKNRVKRFHIAKDLSKSDDLSNPQSTSLKENMMATSTTDLSMECNSTE